MRAKDGTKLVSVSGVIGASGVMIMSVPEAQDLAITLAEYLLFDKEFGYSDDLHLGLNVSVSVKRFGYVPQVVLAGFTESEGRFYCTYDEGVYILLMLMKTLFGEGKSG